MNLRARTSPHAARAAPTREVLANGVTLLLLEDRAAPIVTLQAWFRTGSIHEGAWLGCGISHYVEHMLFKGTPTRAVGQFAREIAAAGGHLNAYTHTERTVFHLHLPAGSFPTALAALADVLRHSSFEEAEAAKEREVILHELHDHQEQPSRILWDLLHRTAFRVHPFRFPIGGSPERFGRLTRDDLVSFWKQRYVPEHLTIAAVGDLRTAEALPRLRDAFADWDRRPPAPAWVPAEPPQCGRREAADAFRIRDTRLLLGWHTVAATHPDLYALDVLAYVLGIGRNSRLPRAVRDRRRLVFDVDAGSYVSGEPGIFLASAVCPPEREDEAVAAILAEIARIQEAPAERAEIEQARNKVLAGFYYGRQTVESLAQALAVAEITFGDLEFDERYVEAIRRVEPEDLTRVARTWLHDRSLTVTALRPRAATPAVGGNGPSAPADGGSGPDAPVNASASSDAAMADGASSRPQPVLDVLPGGVRLITLEDRRLPVVSVYATLFGGVRYEDPRVNGVSQAVSQLLTRGTARRPAEEIEAAIESIGAGLAGVSGRNTLGIAATTLSAHFAPVLGLLAECLREPAFDEGRLEQVKTELRSRIRNREERPWDVNAILFLRALYGPHPYAFPALGTEESVAGLTREDCRAFHGRVLSAGNLVVAVAGDIDPAEARTRVAEALAGLPEREAWAPSHAPPMPPMEPVERRQELAGQSLTAVMLGFPTVSFAHPDRTPLEVLEQCLSAMGGRMFVRLRDELALAYQVGCTSAVQYETGYFGFYILCRPDQVRRALEEMRGEIGRMRREGVEERELEEARAALIGGELHDLQTLGARAQSMALDELYGLGFAHRFGARERLEAVRAHDLRRVAETYFDDRRAVVAITGPISP